MLIFCPHLPRWPRLSSYWLSVSSLVVNYLWFSSHLLGSCSLPLFRPLDMRAPAAVTLFSEGAPCLELARCGRQICRKCQCSFCQPEASSVPCTLTALSGSPRATMKPSLSLIRVYKPSTHTANFQIPQHYRLSQTPISYYQSTVSVNASHVELCGQANGRLRHLMWISTNTGKVGPHSNGSGDNTKQAITSLDCLTFNRLTKWK